MTKDRIEKINTDYNIAWRKRHDDTIWHSVTPPPPPFEKYWLRPWTPIKNGFYYTRINDG